MQHIIKHTALCGEGEGLEVILNSLTRTEFCACHLVWQRYWTEFSFLRPSDKDEKHVTCQTRVLLAKHEGQEGGVGM